MCIILTLLVVVRAVLSSRIGGAISEYQFQRSDCIASLYQDSSIGKLVGPLTPDVPGSGQCLQSNGVNHRYQSQSIPGLPSLLKSGVLTLDFWVQFNELNDKDGELVSFCDLSPHPKCSLQVEYV